MPRLVDELIQNHEIAPADLLPQAAASRGGQDMGDTAVFERLDIGPIVHLAGTELVFATVPGDQHHVRPAEFTHGQRG